MKTTASGRRAAMMVAPAILAAAALLTTGCGGSGAGNTAQSRLLSAADLPAGWSATPVSQQDVQTSAPCLSGLPANHQGYTYARAAFVQGTSIPSLGEVLATGPQAQRQWQSLNSALARCVTATITVGGEKSPVTIRPIAFPRVGSGSSAYAWTFTVSGIPIGDDLILFHAGSYEGYLAYAGVGSPSVATVRAFAAAAVAKAEHGSTAPVPGSVSITSAPVLTAQTKLGPVAYRATGNGPPLVLIAGYSTTMEGWDPRLVQSLAQHFRVVIFDNAGFGGTQA